MNVKRGSKLNPARLDPQRLGLLRRQFLGALRKEFSRLQSSVWDQVVTQDSFGLRDIKPLSFNTRWKHLTLDQQVDNFKEFLSQEFNKTLLRTDPRSNEIWLGQFAKAGYQRGILRSYADTHRLRRALKPMWYQAQQQQFMRTVLASQEGRAKERVVVTRVADNVKGVADEISKNCTRILLQGLTQRLQPKALGHKLINEIKGIRQPLPNRRKSLVANARRGNDARAASIVYTDLAYAHSEGQLDALDEMGLEDVTVFAEWVTGDNPCPDCEEMESTIWTLEDAYGILPLHPFCQCSWVAVDEEGDDITSDWFT